MSTPSPELFRNVEGHPADPVDTWPFEGLSAVIERGLLPDWQPILRAVRAEPWGVVAHRVLHYTHIHPDDDATPFFRLFVSQARQDREAAERQEVARRVRSAIAASGMTAATFASRIGTSASRLSTYANGLVTPSAAMLLRIEGQSHP